ncbi:MAG: hypothetical protein H3Z52_03540 [archaeon]|nr:hypothetical protein [archaeon]MCP8318036.1 hypothetical protein [archaeon]MCP8320003.1 hypothetical protein [archaeon]
MASQSKISYTSFFLATAIVILLVTGMTIGAELYKPLKDWLAITFGHHWVGKSVIAFLAFFIIALGANSYFAKREQDIGKWATITIVLMILSSLAILGFFTLHYYKLI